MEIASPIRVVKASELSLDQLARDGQVNETAKIEEVSRQFEALLLRQILQSAHAVSGAVTDKKSSTVNGIYEDLATAQLADAMTSKGAGGLGLGQSLARQLGAQLAGTKALAESVSDD
ncbi:MAG: rod-binding protein [Verrucomicrobia bacterium]|nr:rod-binding protein [Verrucomicrobiota bacterium]